MPVRGLLAAFFVKESKKNFTYYGMERREYKPERGYYSRLCRFYILA